MAVLTGRLAGWSSEIQTTIVQVVIKTKDLNECIWKESVDKSTKIWGPYPELPQHFEMKKRSSKGNMKVPIEQKKNQQIMYPYGEGNGNPLQYSCLENPSMEEPGGLQSMVLLRAGHNWATSLLLFTFMHWRRNWQPTPVFLPGESQGRGSLVGCHLWGRTESDTTEAT